MTGFNNLAALFRCSQHAFSSARKGSHFKRLKFICRSWKSRKSHLDWFDYLQTDDFMRKLAKYNNRHYRKLYRPYLSTSWSKSRSLAILKTSYAYLRQAVQPDILEQIFLTDTFRLAEWTSKRTYQLCLTHDPRFFQEGELTLSLRCPDLGEGELALLSGTIAPADDGTMTFYIGGLQGAARSLGAPAIKEAGRDLHGLRPKSLILIAGQLLGRRFGCNQILATNATCHAYSTDARRQNPKLQKMFFDFDLFWEESGGLREDDAFFKLPLVTSRRPREDMKPQKRPMYQRRYAMLDEIEAGVASAITPTPTIQP